ncbi:MAG: hypothetical protein H6713_39795 [Myxococcales bacterium]|nr:hypothetical protein [Myxococcales bacterium]
MKRAQRTATTSARLLGRAGLALAVLALGSCFRGEFLNRTCEELGTCDAGTSDASESDSTATTTTTEGIGDDVLAFRVNTIEIVDPDLYAAVPACDDITPIVNLGALQPELDKGDINIAVLLPDYDPKAESGDIIIQRVQCEVPDKMCYRDGPAIYGFFGNNYASDCLEIPEAAIKPSNLAELNVPVAPCLLTLEGTVYLDIGTSIGQIQLRNGRVAATYDNPNDPQSLVNGVMRGFVTEQQARELVFEYGGTESTLWALVHGGESCLGVTPPYDTEMEMIDGELTNGFWLYVNFTGERVDWSPLAKPDDPTTGGSSSTGDPTTGDPTTTDTDTGTGTGP